MAFGKPGAVHIDDRGAVWDAEEAGEFIGFIEGHCHIQQVKALTPPCRFVNLLDSLNQVAAQKQVVASKSDWCDNVDTSSIGGQLAVALLAAVSGLCWGWGCPCDGKKIALCGFSRAGGLHRPGKPRNVAEI